MMWPRLGRSVGILALVATTLGAQGSTGRDRQPGEQQLVIGAKNFTESSVLAELMAQIIEARTAWRVERRFALGGTQICHAALVAGEIDGYAEYTGTAWSVVLHLDGQSSDPLQTFLSVQRGYREQLSLAWLEPFGLDNTYALTMSEAVADRLAVERISDLLPHLAELRAGFSIEFSERPDGLPGLRAHYGLNLVNVRALEHGLAYSAIDNGAIELMDAYSTDGKLLRYPVRVLEDDRGFFPPYHAAPVVRMDTLARDPAIAKALGELAYRVRDRDAQALNFLVENGHPLPTVVHAFLRHGKWVGAGETPSTTDGSRLSAVQEQLSGLLDTKGPTRALVANTPSARLGTVARWRNHPSRYGHLLLEHLGLALIAVLLAALVAIPLGIAMVRRPRLRTVGLGLAGALQTIPSLALLAFMIPLLGLDVKAAVAALLLYALLPILRNTYTGIGDVDPDLIDAARGLGMTNSQILRTVQLPLALPTIMAGVRTATVIGIGVATLAAFIGAGGLGEPIVEGLYLNDPALILSGAIPAAALALVADWTLGWFERALQPWRSHTAS